MMLTNNRALYKTHLMTLMFSNISFIECGNKLSYEAGIQTRCIHL